MISRRLCGWFIIQRIYPSYFKLHVRLAAFVHPNHLLM
ncbi:hypothetical protein yinte0001_42150 [Yersinia intermedia ATCC 29909]|nr:hypothetical protein yinte0001_42150 [Yersinia intermedia ATCC 29909]